MLGYKRIAGTITASDYHFPDKERRYVVKLIMKAQVDRQGAPFSFSPTAKNKQPASWFLKDSERYKFKASI